MPTQSVCVLLLHSPGRWRSSHRGRHSSRGYYRCTNLRLDQPVFAGNRGSSTCNWFHEEALREGAQYSVPSLWCRADLKHCLRGVLHSGILPRVRCDRRALRRLRALSEQALTDHVRDGRAVPQ